MSIYGDAAGGDELSGGLTAPGGARKAGGPLASVAAAGASVAAAAGPTINAVKAKAAADPQKAKVVAAAMGVLILSLIGWAYYASETPAIARCDEACPDVLFSAGLINGLNGTAKNACGGQHVHDAAVPGHEITLHGDTRVSEIGAHFDGGGDYITVENFDYYSDGTFTIGFWYTKERCTGGIYEYLYSHNQYRNSMEDDSSNINIYLGCEEAGGGFTNLYNPNAPTGENRAGSTIRFSLTDAGGRGDAQSAEWDYPLHDARGSQDAILNVWLHVAVAVDIPKQSFRTFINGNPVADNMFAYYCGSVSMCSAVVRAPSTGACLLAPPPPPPIPGCETELESPARTIMQGVDRLRCRGPGVVWSASQPDDWDPSVNGQWIPAQLPSGAGAGTAFDPKCAYYNYQPALGGAPQVTNIACPSPTQLSGQFGGLLLLGDIHLGGRSDLNAYRHFTGRMAGVTIASEAKAEVSCLFGCGHDSLPGIGTLQKDICTTIVEPLVNAPLSSPKCSGSAHVAKGSCAMYGSRLDGQYAPAEFSDNGARFDGDGDYIEIPSIDYGSEATFTISFWFTKGQASGQTLSGNGQSGCTENLYEYLYSHNERSEGSITSYEDPLSGAGSNVNIYIGCDQAEQGGTHTAGYATCNHNTGYHTQPGTVLRVNLMDSGTSDSRRAVLPADFCGIGGINPEREVVARSNWAMFDVSLHNAGSFDQLTTNWIHFALTVTPSKVAMYLDGIEQHQFCFFDPAPSPPPEDPYAVPPPPPPIPFGCPPPPPAPEPMPAQCTNFLECGQAYCPPPPAPGTSGGLDTLAPPPPPVDAQDSRLNIAYPNPEELYGSFNKFQLAGPITIGGRSDHSRYRHFKGAMRSVSIYSSALTPTEIQCIFTHDDAVFSGALAPSSNGATVACPAIVWLALLAMSVWCQ